jgi:hypothetical protein
MYARAFKSFHSLSILHLDASSYSRRPKPTEKDYKIQTDKWISAARSAAIMIPWLDFLGWHGEHYIVANARDAHGETYRPELKELPARRRLDCGIGVDLGGEDGCWLERKDVPIDYEMSGLEV